MGSGASAASAKANTSPGRTSKLFSKGFNIFNHHCRPAVLTPPSTTTGAVVVDAQYTVFRCLTGTFRHGSTLIISSVPGCRMKLSLLNTGQLQKTSTIPSGSDYRDLRAVSKFLPTTMGLHSPSTMLKSKYSLDPAIVICSLTVSKMLCFELSANDTSARSGSNALSMQPAFRPRLHSVDIKQSLAPVSIDALTFSLPACIIKISGSSPLILFCVTGPSTPYRVAPIVGMADLPPSFPGTTVSFSHRRHLLSPGRLLSSLVRALLSTDFSASDMSL